MEGLWLSIAKPFETIGTLCRHDGVRSGHQRSPYFLPQCGHAIHVFGLICMQNSTTMLREAYLTDLELSLQSQGQGQVTKGQFWKFIFLDKWHTFWDQFCLRNTIKATKSVYEVILGQKSGHYGSTLKIGYDSLSFGSSPNQTKKARDSKFAMNMHYIDV